MTSSSDSYLGTAGLGAHYVRTLAATGSPHIFFTGRNTDAANELMSESQTLHPSARLTFIQCDMTSLPSMSEAASSILSQTTRLDLLFCNAGIMAIPAALTQEGYEIQFGVNHLAHALLLKKLLPVLQRTAAEPGSDVRVITTTSLGYRFATTISFDTLKTTQESAIFGAFRRYGQSKLANILFTQALAKKYPDIKFVATHPGVINTGLISGLSGFNRYFTQTTTWHQQVSVEEGAKNGLWAAFRDGKEVASGEFYEPVGKPGVQSTATKNGELEERLWKWTEEALEKY